MINFNEWLDNKWQLLLGAGRDNWDDEDMKMAYNKGMERAAEIAEPFRASSGSLSARGSLVLLMEDIRKEIETISISDIRKEVEK